MSLFRTKPITLDSHSSSLKRCLTTFHLTLFGIGAIIGAGVFVLTGVAAATKAGPAISLSYILAGFAALFSALSYAELATSIGGSGSAYNYVYSSFGELLGWIIGWALVLEYAMAVSTVAVGWSGYVVNALNALHVNFPVYLQSNSIPMGLINLPAFFIIGLLTLLLCTGINHTAKINSSIVVIKLLIILLFIIVAIQHVKIENWTTQFFPFGFKGITEGASLVFFAYVGFDAISTTVEETINPQKDLPRGIIYSLLSCTVIYIIVSLLLTGIVSYKILNVASPVSEALLAIGQPLAAAIIAFGAVAGLTTVMLVMFYGLTRILYAISRDGLLPSYFSKINRRTQTPIRTIIPAGIVLALIAGFIPLAAIAELVNIGTLTAFTFVCASVIYLRWKHPNMARPFKLLYNPLIPSLGIILCLFLIFNLPLITLIRFVIWIGIGLVVYFSYGRKYSLLNTTVS